MINSFNKLFLLLLLIFSFLDAKQREFKVSYDPDYAPFSYIQNGKPEGLFIDFWKLWAQKNQYKITFVNGQFWDNAIDLVKNKKVDFFLGTTAYEEWMKESNKFYSLQTSVFINKENEKGFSKDAAYIIGIIGNDYEELIKKNFPNSQIVIFQTYNDIFRDLSSKKIDMIYDDKLAIEYYALQNGYFHIIRSIKLFMQTSDISAISNSEELTTIFNNGFSNLTNEELNFVESKWILDENQRIYKSEITLTPEEKEFILNHKINISLSKNWKPFSFVLQDKPAGISTEIWQIIAQTLGVKYNFTYFDSFSDELNAIKNKKQDIILSVGETEDRKKYALFSDSYISFPISIVTLKDENFIENISYLFDKKIAVGENFTAHQMLKKNYPNLNFVLVKNPQQGLEYVRDKKAFAYVDIKPSLAYNIKKSKFDTLKISGNTGLYFDLKIMIRDDYPLLQSILNKAITLLNKEEISLIIRNWENIYIEENFNYKFLWLVLIISIVIFALLVYFNQLNLKRNKTLQHLVDERTSELKTLNEELEQRVKSKTKELLRANYLLDEAQEIAKLGSFSYNAIKKTLIWSDEHYKIFGLYVGEVNPSIDIFLSFVHPDDKSYVKKELIKAIKIKRKHSFEYRIKLKDEAIKYIQSTSKITKFTPEGRAILVVGTILDITKTKKLELEKREQATILAQQSKMAAMGEMLENIAHQWRQPLSVISTAATGMQLQHEINNHIDEDFLIQSIKSINEQSQYLSKTIDDFRNFFNPKKTLHYFDIKSSIENSLNLIESRVKKNSIVIDQELESVFLKTLESELIQTLLNILNNAIDAIEINKIEKPYIKIKTYKENNNLIIEIKDNAGGIPKAILHRILEPYFTTKHKSQGTGIGLYMSNEIITKHLNGKLLVSNCRFPLNEVLYSGAFFTIALPLKDKS